jgi:glycosyltransferase involved in cell wall biosynthesis
MLYTVLAEIRLLSFQVDISMKFSIITPARNEERSIGACLKSIQAAAEPYQGQVESIVVVNRCTDGTERIARDQGAIIIHDDVKNLSKLRNAGAAVAQGQILITVDADSTMSPNLLVEVDRALVAGKFVGGGVYCKLERYSLGILCSSLMFLPFLLRYPFIAGGGCFWCRRKDFEAIGGFDERLFSSEDADFARRLKRHGKRHGKRFKALFRAHITTSCRKFDQLGDWYVILHPWLLLTYVRGTNRQLADKLLYDVER